ncbi:MAG: hypothetical protein QOF63_317 [Thermoanaerobaculia bacterium]|jgi:hypothetical protein|nr:hypothetical protein [Thermoanaerobaculia bacterium]
MTCKRIVAALSFCVAAAAHGEDLKVITAAVLYETGLAAPSIELRSVSEDGAVWRGSINGWTFSLARERPVDRGRRVVMEIRATPYDAHSSRRMYRDGLRAPDLDFDDAALSVRAGMRFRQGEHGFIEPALVIGDERIGGGAPLALRNAWRSPYAGFAVTQRIRFVTADDPFTNRIEGIDVTATAEAYHGNRTWMKAIAAEYGGVSAGRVHLQQTVAVFGGSGLDTVSAFLAGGSWDLLGPTAVYGTRYDEFRLLHRGLVASAGADVDVTRGFALGARAGALRSGSTHPTGAMLLATQRAGGFRIAAGVARSRHRTTMTITVIGAAFRP